MKRLNMLVGIPGSGKSTYITKCMDPGEETVIVSTDKYIEKMAAIEGKTYSQVFQRFVKEAGKNMDIDLQYAISMNKNIVWDQTNLTVATRAKKLAKIPKDYFKTAIYFPVPEDLNERLASRVGKNIPKDTLAIMISQIEKPSTSEGFHAVVQYNWKLNKLETLK